MNVALKEERRDGVPNAPLFYAIYPSRARDISIMFLVSGISGGDAKYSPCDHSQKQQ
jgi:hypothetical protein